MTKNIRTRVFGFLLILTMSTVLAACGGDDKGTVEIETPTATPTAEPVTAYDETILRESEKDIESQMRVIANEGSSTMDPGSLNSHCTPTSERNFTCESSVSITLTANGYTLCSDLEATQSGYITNPETGDYTWKNTATKGGDPYPC